MKQKKRRRDKKKQEIEEEQRGEARRIPLAATRDETTASAGRWASARMLEWMDALKKAHSCEKKGDNFVLTKRKKHTPSIHRTSWSRQLIL